MTEAAKLYAYAMRIVDECAGLVRRRYGMGPIVMPMGPLQALCETLAELCETKYEMTDEGVEFDA